MLAKLERLIGEIGDINSKLILLVGYSRSGKTQLLRHISARLNIEPLKVGLELGHRLTATPNNKRGFSAGEFLREMADKERTDDPLWLDDLPSLPQTRTPLKAQALNPPHKTHFVCYRGVPTMSNIPFDPSKFTAAKAKPLPVILLLDVSGSMIGEKIRNLNDAVRDMLDVFRDTENSETEIWVAIITFGEQVKLHQSLVSTGDIQWQDLSAGGTTPLGVALQMAKAMIEDKDVVPSRAYRPMVVLVSDGQPDNGWESPLNEFISVGRSAKCDRMAMAIGADADEAVLGKFIVGTPNPLFYAENAKQLRDFFKLVTMSVSNRTNSPTPNVVPEASVIDIKPATIEARLEKSKSVTQKSSDEDGGYW